MKYLNSLSKHTGSIRSLEIIKVNESDYFVLSAGSSSEMFLHLLRFAEEVGQYKVKEIKFLTDLSVVQKDLDSRVMSIDYLLEGNSLNIFSTNTLGQIDIRFIKDINCFLQGKESFTVETIKLRSHFIGVCIKSIRYLNDIYIFVGLTNGLFEIILLKEIGGKNEIVEHFLSDKIHEAAINGLVLISKFKYLKRIIRRF